MAGRATAGYPTTIWDGASASRSAVIDNEPIADVHRDADADDYKRAVAEIIAVQTSDTRLRLISGAGNTAALATTATSGHGYIPTCAGTPTGVPATVTGFAALIYDTTAHKLWHYDAGWKTVGAAS